MAEALRRSGVPSAADVDGDALDDTGRVPVLGAGEPVGALRASLLMLAGLVLAGVVVSAAAAGRFGRPAAPALAFFSVAWLVVNKRVEGPVLWTLSPQHGLVAADLAGLAGLLLAGVTAFWPHRD